MSSIFDNLDFDIGYKNDQFNFSIGTKRPDIPEGKELVCLNIIYDPNEIKDPKTFEKELTKKFKGKINISGKHHKE